MISANDFEPGDIHDIYVYACVCVYVCIDVRIVLPVKGNKLSFNDSYMHICIYIHTMFLRFTRQRSNYYVHVYIYEYTRLGAMFRVRAVEVISASYG